MIGVDIGGERGVAAEVELRVAQFQRRHAKVARFPIGLRKGDRAGWQRVVTQGLEHVHDGGGIGGVDDRVSLQVQQAVLLDERAAAVDSSVDGETALGRGGIGDVDIAGEMAVPEGRGINAAGGGEGQVHRGGGAAIGENGAGVGAVQSMKGDIVAVDVERAPAESPLDVVRIDLAAVRQHQGRAAADDAGGREGLDPVGGIGALRQDDGAISNVQRARVDP
ncbi:hypothetical protein LMG1864_05480 [Achromobacter ruhlandii]|nr:hypothetical protein LMG1864_05480 [Achromobacter ruhlandii]